MKHPSQSQNYQLADTGHLVTSLQSIQRPGPRRSPCRQAASSPAPASGARALPSYITGSTTHPLASGNLNTCGLCGPIIPKLYFCFKVFI